MIGFIVRDLTKSLEFYRALGLDVPEDPGEQDHVECLTPNGYRLAWDSEALIREINPDWVEPQGQRISLAFLCDSPAEVDEIYNHLIELGYPGVKPPWDAFWGQRYAVVADPDGNSIDLFAPL